jgi:hypothetical protein
MSKIKINQENLGKFSQKFLIADKMGVIPSGYKFYLRKITTIFPYLFY